MTDINIDKQGRVPVYEQIIEEIEKQILTGVLAPGETIPSVRALSLELSVNPNTIQKAYNELERRNITYSVPGVGRYVSKQGLQILKNDLSESEAKLKKAVEEFVLAGVSLPALTEKVVQMYQEKEKEIGIRKEEKP